MITGARLGAVRKSRLPHDRKTLTDHGRQALQRTNRSMAAKGELWRGSKVWQLVYNCAGTSLCDVPQVSRRGCKCDVRVVFSATIEQVSEGKILATVTGVSR